MLPIITASVAFLLGFFSATYFAMRQADISSINDHLEDIKQIESLAVLYWLGEFKSPQEQASTGHRLRGKLHAAALFRERSSNLLGCRYVEFRSLDGDLFDVATGGDFESASFSPSPETAITVMTKCNEIRALLRTVRKHIYWAH